jgi:gamma-glutamyl:cysteine ligase YbdK (ATP-grasp superfamily)
VSGAHPYRLFEAVGVELEYMIVDRAGLSVLPIADLLIRDEGGRLDAEVIRGDVAWSNELALHLIELKTSRPAPSLAGLAASFQANARRCDERLARRGARLMPTSMHPWMDPDAELRLWPHDDRAVYEAFDRIFDCRGHGWANVQSCHINLPFAGDREFGRLHAAIRLLLPILPALAASSPVVGGRPTGLLDTRMEFYRTLARRIPSVTGLVVPEPAFTRADYQARILDRIYADLAPHDPQGILRHEWANARGCIARFERGSIEIRVLDMQEAPAADLGVAAATIAALRALAAEVPADLERQQRWEAEPLAAILGEVIRDGERAVIRDREFLGTLGFPGASDPTAGDLWAHLIEAHPPGPDAGEESHAALRTILREGPLARRVLAALGGEARPGRLHEVYEELCRCLSDGRPFHA